MGQSGYQSWGEEIPETLLETIAEAATSSARFSQGEEINDFAREFVWDFKTSSDRYALEAMLKPNDFLRVGVNIGQHVRFHKISPRVFKTFADDPIQVVLPTG